MKESIVRQKSFAFAVRIVNLFCYLTDEKKDFILSKQLIRSGTGIGANVSEALKGASKKDFANKMNIALKEANESQYWLELLHATEYIDDIQYQSIKTDCDEIVKILVAIVKTANKTDEK